MLKLNNIYHKYGNEKWILKNLSYTFDAQRYILLGPSGIGKSTLLHIATKIVKPISGYVVSNYKIANIFQSLNLLNDFTLKENIELAGKIKGIKSCYSQIVEMTQITHILDKYPNQVSGGEKQRAAIARALSVDANFILADEPTGNLDPENAAIIRNIFNLINSELKIGFIVSTHDYAWLDVGNRKLEILDGALKCTHL